MIAIIKLVNQAITYSSNL